MGLYGEAVIATRKDDADTRMEGIGWAIYAQLILLMFCCILAWLSGSFIVYFTWDYIGLIVAGIVIGLGLWACRRLGTEKSMFDRFRYRKITVSKRDRDRIRRRLTIKV